MTIIKRLDNESLSRHLDYRTLQTAPESASAIHVPMLHSNLRKISPRWLSFSAYTLQIPPCPGGSVYPFSCLHVMHLFVFRVYLCSSPSVVHTCGLSRLLLFSRSCMRAVINTGTLLVSIIASALHSAATPEQMCAKDHL